MMAGATLPTVGPSLPAAPSATGAPCPLCTLPMCAFSDDFCRNVLSHWSHSNLAPWWCTAVWENRLPFWANVFLQIVHSYGRSPEWNRWWFDSVNDVANAFPQILHPYGRSPVCTRLCLASADVCENAFLQTVHSNGLSPVWIREWVVRLQRCENDLRQTGHWNGRSPLCTRACRSSCDLDGNTLSQCAQGSSLPDGGRDADAAVGDDTGDVGAGDESPSAVAPASLAAGAGSGVKYSVALASSSTSPFRSSDGIAGMVARSPPDCTMGA